MNIVVLVKQVPDTGSERTLSDSDFTIDRDSDSSVLDEINERAVEAALQLQETHGGEVTVVCMGPDKATDAIRKALSMGADKAVHLCDDALRGSCAVQTARVLARAVGTVGDFDLLIAGDESTDGASGAVPAMLAELLDLPQLTRARSITVDGTTITVERETDDGLTTATASLPVVVSVNEKINDPRYPSFKGIMAAKKKPVSSLTLADVGVDAGEVGLANALSTVLEVVPRPARTAGQKITDEGDGGQKIVEYLIAQKLV